MNVYIANVGFPVNSLFSSNGLTKFEFFNIRIEAKNKGEAKKHLIKAYPRDILITSIKLKGI